jgi:hypothetical protein
MDRLEAALTALTRKVVGIEKLAGCMQCNRYASKRVAVTSPRSGASSQDLCDRCEPRHPLIGMKGVVVSEVPLAQAAKAESANAGLDLLLEAYSG